MLGHKGGIIMKGNITSIVARTNDIVCCSEQNKMLNTFVFRYILRIRLQISCCIIFELSMKIYISSGPEQKVYQY